MQLVDARRDETVVEAGQLRRRAAGASRASARAADAHQFARLMTNE